MSGYHVNIAYNGNGDGDWVIVECEGETVYSGHNIGISHLFDILEACNGMEFMNYYETLTNEQIQNWPACLDEGIEPTRKYRL
jgi:hypothetical protein